MKKMFRTVLLLIAFSQMLTSCFTYTDILKNREVTEDFIYSENDFEIGNKYELITKDEKVLVLNLNEFSADGIIGSGTLKTVQGVSQPAGTDTYSLRYDEIEEVKRHKFNLGLTALGSSVLLIGVILFLSSSINMGPVWQ